MYETRQPITTANIQAAIASIAAREHATPRPAAIGAIRLKTACRTAIVERMAEQMLDHGEGMTEGDLIRLGWSHQIVDLCAADANRLARHRSNMN